MAKLAHHSLPASADTTSNLMPRELTKQEFGRRLHGLMLAKDWNQSDLGKAAGLGRDSVSTYIRGLTFPTTRALRRLADALGVTPEDLLPNTLKQAMEDEHPAIELRQAVGQPEKAWLRINRAVPFSVAARIVALINEADEAERK